MSVNTPLTDDHAHEHTSVKGYLAVFGALMVLTVITYALNFFEFGLLGNAVGALTVAVCKTSLVLYYFMHLRESPKIIWLVALGSFAWLAILFLFTITDFMAMRAESGVGLPNVLGW